MVERLRDRGHPRRGRAGGDERGAAAHLRRRGARDPRLRGHAAADRQRPDDLAAVGRRADDRARARRRASSSACSRSAPAAATRPRCSRRSPARSTRSSASARCVAKARRNLQALKVKNVRLKHGDGSADLGEDARGRRDRRHRRRDARADGAAQVPRSPAGAWCCRSRSAASDGDGVQRLTVIEAAPGGFREQTFDAVRFVPLLPGLA